MLPLIHFCIYITLQMDAGKDYFVVSFYLYYMYDSIFYRAKLTMTITKLLLYKWS